MNHPNRSRTCRPREILRDFSADYSNWFRHVAEARAAAFATGDNLDVWRAVYAPRDLATEYFSAFSEAGDNPRTPSELLYIMVIGQALAAWRMGMGVYRFNPALAQALIDTPLDARLPVHLLAQLPEWGIWVETAGLFPESDITGFFATLDGKTDTGVDHLRLIFWGAGYQQTTLPVILAHEGMTFQESLAAISAPGAEVPADYAELFAAAVSLTLYLCSTEPDYQGTDRPKNPSPVKTKKGWRLFPAASPRIWEIGQTVGERLRAAQADQLQATVDRAVPRPHLRRAHWHTYRTGQGRQGYRVRWLHPILVGYKEG